MAMVKIAYMILFTILSSFLVGCGGSGCGGEDSYDNGFRVFSNYHSKYIVELYYPQVNKHIIYNKDYYSNHPTRYEGFLRGFSETIILLKFNDGQIDTLHFRYDRQPIYAGECENKLNMSFNNIKLISSPNDSLSIEYY